MGREPAAQMAAEQRRLEVCFVCGGRSSFVIGNDGVCRDCALGPDVHDSETCPTVLRGGGLAGCDCGARQRIRSL